MALAMLGLRVRIFDANDEVIQEHDLLNLFEIFDALINPRLTPCALNIVYSRMDIRFISEMKTTKIFNLEVKRLPSSRILILLDNESDFQMWEPLCLFLNLPKPAQNFPNRATSKSRLFRAD